ncbi:MAG: hypothetical protein NTX44_05160 [Ignavibacteriales bacterium]|nr:hypothetical protein [Ignavibacteriales bacterium]
MDYLNEVRWLVDQLGYKGSPFREDYISKVLPIGRYDTSRLLRLLRKEKQMRNHPILKSNHSKHLSVSDLSSYTFCPASYSISETYDSCKTDNMILGEELHDKMYLENYLLNIRNKRTREAQDKNLDFEKTDKFIHRGIYGDLLNSTIIFQGHSAEKKKPFFNEKKTLSGIPDYIFEHPDKSKFVVEEKHTWREDDLTNPFPNHKIQIHGYIQGIKSLDISYGYIIYFHWLMKRARTYNYVKTSHAQIFQITKTNAAISELADVFHKVQSLKEGCVLDFNDSNINIEKCVHCSTRALCNHKSGLFNTVIYPYYKNKKRSPGPTYHN